MAGGDITREAMITDKAAGVIVAAIRCSRPRVSVSRRYSACNAHAVFNAVPHPTAVGVRCDDSRRCYAEMPQYVAVNRRGVYERRSVRVRAPRVASARQAVRRRIVAARFKIRLIQQTSE